MAKSHCALPDDTARSRAIRHVRSIFQKRRSAFHEPHISSVFSMKYKISPLESINCRKPGRRGRQGVGDTDRAQTWQDLGQRVLK